MEGVGWVFFWVPSMAGWRVGSVGQSECCLLMGSFFLVVVFFLVRDSRMAEAVVVVRVGMCRVGVAICFTKRQWISINFLRRLSLQQRKRELEPQRSDHAGKAGARGAPQHGSANQSTLNASARTMRSLFV